MCCLDDDDTSSSVAACMRGDGSKSAISIPASDGERRDRGNGLHDFTLIKVLGKGSFGKVTVHYVSGEECIWTSNNFVDITVVLAGCISVYFLMCCIWFSRDSKAS